MRAGIVGGGFMGQVHARAVRASGAEVARAVASTPARSRLAASRLGASAVSASVADLVHDDQVDVVHVCTPNHLHAQVVAAAVEAGKPVVCEKPLATTLAGATEIWRLATGRGVLTSVPFVYRFHPMIREARSRAERANRLLTIHGSYLQDWLSDPATTNWRVDSALGGASRAFADIGVHWCDLIEFVTGDRIARLIARTIVAHERPTLPPTADRPTEDAVTVMFQTEGGASGTSLISQVSLGRRNRLQFCLDYVDESIAFDQEHPDELWIGTQADTRVLYRGVHHQSPDAQRLNILPPGHPQGYQDCFNAFVADSYAAFQGDIREGLPTFVDGVRAAVLTEAVLASATREQWVEVPALNAEFPSTTRPRTQFSLPS